MTIRDELLRHAYQQDESLVDMINEYADLRERFIHVVGRDDASEASPMNIDVHMIDDSTRRHEAEVLARRLRYLARYVCSRLM